MVGAQVSVRFRACILVGMLGSAGAFVPVGPGLALRAPLATHQGPSVAGRRALGALVGARRDHSRLRGLRMGLFDDDEGEWINTNLIKAATAAGGTAKGPLGRLGSALQERPRGPQEPIRTSTSGATAYGVYAGLSCEGYGKGSQVGGTNNQASFAVNSLGNGIDLLGVFDGHGKAGGECSAFIAAEMARQLEVPHCAQGPAFLGSGHSCMRKILSACALGTADGTSRQGPCLRPCWIACSPAVFICGAALAAAALLPLQTRGPVDWGSADLAPPLCRRSARSWWQREQTPKRHGGL